MVSRFVWKFSIARTTSKFENLEIPFWIEICEWKFFFLFRLKRPKNFQIGSPNWFWTKFTFLFRFLNQDCPKNCILARDTGFLYWDYAWRRAPFWEGGWFWVQLLCCTNFFWFRPKVGTFPSKKNGFQRYVCFHFIS